MSIMSGTDKDAVPQSELDRYGIERVPADVFLWSGYRYSNARDAIAAAKRTPKEIATAQARGFSRRMPSFCGLGP